MTILTDSKTKYPWLRGILERERANQTHAEKTVAYVIDRFGHARYVTQIRTRYEDSDYPYDGID